MESPAITWKQTLVLETLLSGDWVSGRTIRDSLEQHGTSMVRQTFYAMMANMVKGLDDKGGLVEGKFEDVEDKEFSLQQRFYCITDHGRHVHREALELWQQRIDALKKADKEADRTKPKRKRKKKT